MINKVRNAYIRLLQSQENIAGHLSEINSALKNISGIMTAAYENPVQPHRKYILSNIEEVRIFTEIYKNVCKVIPGWYSSDTEFVSEFTVDSEALFNAFGEPVPDDVFSKDYRDFILRFFAYIHGKEYSESDEGFLINDIHAPKELNDTAYTYDIDDIDREYKALLDEVNRIKPDKVLEMGSGLGKVCTLLDKAGYNYYGIDISYVYSKIIQMKLKNTGKEERIFNGSFFDIDVFGLEFDCVIFDKSFHHCLEHEKLLDLLYNRTSDNARIILYLEPIFDNKVTPQNLEYGLNIYGADAILQISMRGWLELFFSRQYLVTLFERTRWTIENDTDEFITLRK